MVETRTVRYPADGLTMVGHLAIPDGPGRKPGVLVGHEGPGLNDFQRRRADQLAERGYLALAFDYNGGRWFTEPDEMMARVHHPHTELGADQRLLPGVGYHERHAQRAWRDMLNLLEEAFG